VHRLDLNNTYFAHIFYDIWILLYPVMNQNGNVNNDTDDDHLGEWLEEKNKFFIRYYL
jgi:hypothetical protein